LGPGLKIRVPVVQFHLGHHEINNLIVYLPAKQIIERIGRFELRAG
jgi:hypothetical protein